LLNNNFTKIKFLENTGGPKKLQQSKTWAMLWRHFLTSISKFLPWWQQKNLIFTLKSAAENNNFFIILQKWWLRHPEVDYTNFYVIKFVILSVLFSLFDNKITMQGRESIKTLFSQVKIMCMLSRHLRSPQ
jgi:hypothetical protein